MIALAVLVGGFLGACCRHALADGIQGRTRSWFPLGIFVVNLTGAFLLGLITGLAVRYGWQPWLAVGAGTGAIGAYTTYSTWANDSVTLWREGKRLGLLTNMIGSVVPGVALAALGLLVGQHGW